MNTLKMLGAAALVSLGLTWESQVQAVTKKLISEPYLPQNIGNTRHQAGDTLRDSLFYYTTKSIEKNVSGALEFRFNECAAKTLQVLGKTLDQGNTKMLELIKPMGIKFLGNDTIKNYPASNEYFIISFERSFLDYSFAIFIDGTEVGHLDYEEGLMDLNKNPEIQEVITLFLRKFLQTCKTDTKVSLKNKYYPPAEEKDSYDLDNPYNIPIIGQEENLWGRTYTPSTPRSTPSDPFVPFNIGKTFNFRLEKPRRI